MMIKLVAILAMALLSSCHAASGDRVHNSSSGDSNVDYVISRFFDKIPPDTLSDAQPSELFVNMQLLSMVGREDLNARAVDRPGRARACVGTDVGQRDILAEIRDRAAKTRVVIVNEAHDQPHHRDFIRQVATVLWDEGYRVYAAETFSPFIAQSQLFPYTRTNDGYYSNEPAFGELVREAKRLGYRLAPYEHSASSSDTTLSQHQRAVIREEGQADNLAAIIADLDEGERLLVHAGYSHAAEVPIASFGGKDLAWMAARFKEKTGIDPFTIDQTTCESPDGEIHIFKNSGRVVPGQFDIQIAHPSIGFVDGRPNWRERGGARRVSIPESLVNPHARIIVEARRHGEPLESVPVDRLMLWPKEKLPLLLAPGTYNVVGFREGGGMLDVVEELVVH